MPILTYQEYSKIKHKIPYTLSLKSGANFLYYFGEKHSFDPADPQWGELKQFWNEFLEKTKDQKRIVFIEGGKRDIEESQEQVIIKHSGIGLITYLADKEGIETYSAEPDPKYERVELEKNFSRDVIQYYYFARVVLQWSRKINPRPDFIEYITRYLESDQRESGWGTYDFSLDNMKKVHFELFQIPFNENDMNFFYEISNPLMTKSEINKVSAASGAVRDEYIIDEIRKYIDDDYSIFAEYGCTHVVVQEPVLKELFEPAT